MKILYLDCGMGAAGDMIMGALAALFLPKEQKEFIDKINGIGIPRVKVFLEDDSKCGISGKHIKVMVDGEEEEHGHNHEEQGHNHGEHGHNHEGQEHNHGEHGHNHEEQGHNHEGHGHNHTAMEDIEKIVNGLSVSDKVKKEVMDIYGRIANAESRVHGTTVTKVHFHEVGMMDAIADITGCAMLMEKLAVDRVVVSPVNTGFGQVHCAHGILPVPAPATAELLAGIPAYSGEIRGELCTPTGAALIGYYGDEFGRMPLMTIEKTGYGTGNKNFETANVIRAVLGDSPFEECRENGLVELECNMDDITAEELGFVQELLMENGAREAFFTSTFMKKNRPGTMLTVVCDEKDKKELAKLIFKHTTTIGIREKKINRMILSRKEVNIDTDIGKVRIKISEGYGTRKVKAEYEDLRKIAKEKGMSIDEVKRLIIREYET